MYSNDDDDCGADREGVLVEFIVMCLCFMFYVVKYISLVNVNADRIYK